MKSPTPKQSQYGHPRNKSCACPSGEIVKKIVVAVNLSPHSEATARYGVQIAERFGARLTLVHVFSPETANELITEKDYDAFAKQRWLAEQNLAGLADSISTRCKPCEAVFLVGEPAERISWLARTLHADLIITGSHHPSFLGMLFGLDQAPQIMRCAPCPVLVYYEKQP